MATEETVVPEIEKISESPDMDKAIDLQHDLNLEDVTQPSTEILEELSEFSNLLNLGDDDFNSDLPLVGTLASNEPVLNAAIDLEIAMENAKFLDANPVIAPTVTTSSKPSNPPQTSRHSQATSTADNSRVERVKSPKGTLHITNYVLRKPTPEETKSKKFKCEACPFTGYSRASISIHYLTSHPPCYCKTCGKVYSNPNALTRHMYSHRQNKEFECMDCYERFTFESELASHRMKHRKRPSFKCMFPGCEKLFKWMSELNSHVVTHSGKIQHCKKCDYETNNPRQLRDHQRCHSKELRYKCKYCGERFKYTSGRKRHTDKYH